jgi:hypothetical protein
MGIIDQILNEAENELFPKVANDQNGAPDASSKQQTGGDILSTAQGYLAKVEQFKAALGGQVAAAPTAEGAPGEGQMPNPETGNSVIIARPDGTQIKVAHVMELAKLRKNWR